MTYDWRARFALNFPAPAALNLGVVYIDESSLKDFNKPELGTYRWPLPRHLYGQVVQELTAQGAKAVGFDIFFLDLDHDYTENRVKVSGQGELSSDAYFAWSLRQASNVVLAAPEKEIVNRTFSLHMPAALFRTNALAVGFTHINIDSDGVRRKCRSYVDDPDHGRIWHLGIIMAAQELNLDLAKAVVKPGRIILPGKGAIKKKRIIPIDGEESFYIDWSLPANDDRLQQDNFIRVWGSHVVRSRGLAVRNRWKDKLVVVGAAGIGNNVGDRGPTPIERETELCSSIWNVANSVITDRFIRRSSYLTEMLLIVVMAVISGVLSWRWRALWASVGVLTVAGLYCVIGVWLYVRFRYWLPLILPAVGALLMTHVCMVAYRMFIELIDQRYVRFVKTTFAKTFSPTVVKMLLHKDTVHRVTPLLGLPPSVVNLLLQRQPSAHGGVRRHVSIYFADVRGFTEFIDTSHARAEAYVREQRLTPAEAETFIDNEARDTLSTVNLYLSTIAELVQAHEGTLDKYIGDCVMAFWGAPNANDQHALWSVRAALAAQRAVDALNQQRRAENQKRERENIPHAAAGKPPLPLLPVLNIGSAINSGMATVGFMGSAVHISNYTVFGREVNIASRLEGVAGSGRVIISESTYREIKRDDPTLAATCIALEPVVLRGIQQPVRIYEVPVNFNV